MNTERERLNYYKYLKSQSAALNFFPANIAIIDNQGYIASVNEPWRDFGRKNNLRSMEFGVGSNYLDICDRAKGLWAEEFDHVAASSPEYEHMAGKGIFLQSQLYLGRQTIHAGTHIGHPGS